MFFLSNTKRDLNLKYIPHFDVFSTSQLNKTLMTLKTKLNSKKINSINRQGNMSYYIGCFGVLSLRT